MSVGARPFWIWLKADGAYFPLRLSLLEQRAGGSRHCPFHHVDLHISPHVWPIEHSRAALSWLGQCAAVSLWLFLASIPGRVWLIPEFVFGVLLPLGLLILSVVGIWSPLRPWPFSRWSAAVLQTPARTATVAPRGKPSDAAGPAMPSKASVESYCAAFQEMVHDGTSSFTRTRAAVTELAKVGTPEGMPAAARRGVIRLVEVFADSDSFADLRCNTAEWPTSAYEKDNLAFVEYTESRCGSP